MDWPAMSADISPIEHVWDEFRPSRAKKGTTASKCGPAVSNDYPGMEQYSTDKDSERYSVNASSL